MMSGQNSPRLRGLYAVTPDGLERSVLVDRVRTALLGGVKIVQYRDKQRAAAQKRELAAELCALCRKSGAAFIVNDDVALALAVDADGVHLGGTDGDLSEARQALGSGRLLGASCYADFARARQAMAAGADYVAFGAAYASSTKPLAAVAPHALYTRCRDELGIPVCAIGGITLDNASALITAGADLLAVINGLFETQDIAACAQVFQGLFPE